MAGVGSGSIGGVVGAAALWLATSLASGAVSEPVAPAALTADSRVAAGSASDAAVALAAPEGFAEEVSVGYVLVPVAVRSRSGFVEGLERDDFALSVDGRRVEIDSFEGAGESAIRIALLQDLSGSMDLGFKLAASRSALDCLLERARPDDRFALATFAGRRLRVEVPFTGELSAVREAAAAWRPYGVTALHDAVARIPKIAVSRRAPNAAVVLVTDGVENASELGPGEARRIVREAKIPVYVLGFDRSEEGAGKPGGRGSYSEVLRSLAAFTGGRYFPLPEAGRVATACAEIAAEMRSRYVLGFATTDAGKAAFREIRVQVAGRTVRIAHRRGYTGLPPAE